MLTVRLDSTTPLADQLVSGLRGSIARAEVRPGDSLPTVRQLAADLGIHMNTVSRAYRALEAQGLVSTTRGRGTLVAAARERPAAAQPEQLAARIESALADARLAGLERHAAQALVDRSLDALWPADPADPAKPDASSAPGTQPSPSLPDTEN